MFLSSVGQTNGAFDDNLSKPEQVPVLRSSVTRASNAEQPISTVSEREISIDWNDERLSFSFTPTFPVHYKHRFERSLHCWSKPSLFIVFPCFSMRPTLRRHRRLIPQPTRRIRDIQAPRLRIRIVRKRCFFSLKEQNCDSFSSSMEF